MSNFLDFLGDSAYEKLTRDILSFYVPIALSIPDLRDNSENLDHEIKATNQLGIHDVVTKADIQTQEKIKSKIPENWQFWGEEGSDNSNTFDTSKDYLLITDPIEGTNNFRSFLDDQWGSVISLVDIKTKKPIVGIVAHPSTKTFWIGIHGFGAYKLTIDKDIHIKPLTNSIEKSYNYFTYNNSPHFSRSLEKQVSKFLSLGTTQSVDSHVTTLEKSRLTLDIDEHTFKDPESGALEVIRCRGSIYFKTSAEMAACFVIMEELGCFITDAAGNGWSIGISSLISARTEGDYAFLKKIYDSTI